MAAYHQVDRFGGSVTVSRNVNAILRKASAAIEVVSLPALLERPRYPDGGYYSTYAHYTRAENIALKALCDAKIDIMRSAAALGRDPKRLARRAADTGLSPPTDWNDLRFPGRKEARIAREAARAERKKNLIRRAEPIIPIEYPFIINVRGEHADLIAINEMVPAQMPSHLRADVCQELMLAILEGKTSIDELRRDKSLLKKFIRVYERENCLITSYAISLDRPLTSGGSWYDVLPAPESNDEVFHSFEDLAVNAFPSVVRAAGGREREEHKRKPKYDTCIHGIPNWESCVQCDKAFVRAQERREEMGL